MKTKNKIATLLTLMLCAGQTNAALMFDQDLANGVVFGSGNANGAFTVETLNDIEIGLRGKVRFDENNLPQNTFNSNGDGTYTFDATAPSPGFNFQQNSASTAAWNFEWSVDVSETGLDLSDFTYLFEIDFDPTAGTNFLAFDPINTAAANDNAGGTQVNQNSWNMEFFDQPGFDYLNTTDGQFEFRLSAFSGSNLLASSNITIFQNSVAVSAPSTIALMLLAGFGLIVNRKLKK